MIEIDSWLDPAHYIPNHWFRYYVFVFGIYIAIAYLIFARGCFTTIYDFLVNLFGNSIPRFLGAVFLAGGILHALHAFGFLTKYSKPLLLIVYPILAIYHTLLLFNSGVLQRKLKNLKNEEQLLLLDEENKNYEHIVGRQKDIIARDQESITDLESLLTNVLNASINAIMSFEAVRNEYGTIIDFKFNTINKTACKVFDIARMDAIGNLLLNFIPGTKKIGLFDMFVNVVERDENLRVTKFYDQDNLGIWFDISAVKNRDGFVVTYSDVTEAKNTQEQLLLAERLSMTGKIARSIAHEVRNPLTNVGLALEGFKDNDLMDNEDAQLYYDIIHRNTGRINNLITEMLNSSKKSEFKKEMQSVNKVMEDAIDLVIDRVKLKGMKLNVKLLEQDVQIDMDYVNLHRAFVNILVNAIEAMEEGEGILQVEITNQQNAILVKLSDNGIGIGKEDVKKLFDPFYTNKSNGMGLGLTSTQNTIHDHHGTIKVKSRVGEGTTFSITIPMV